MELGPWCLGFSTKGGNAPTMFSVGSTYHSYRAKTKNSFDLTSFSYRVFEVTIQQAAQKPSSTMISPENRV